MTDKLEKQDEYGPLHVMIRDKRNNAEIKKMRISEDEVLSIDKNTEKRVIFNKNKGIYQFLIYFTPAIFLNLLSPLTKKI